MKYISIFFTLSFFVNKSEKSNLLGTSIKHDIKQAYTYTRIRHQRVSHYKLLQENDLLPMPIHPGR